MKVLIVEDNVPMRRLIRSVVARPSLEVYECGDGAEAVAAYATYQPDWVLMDINLPRVDGLEATRQITTAFPESQILMVTNFDDAWLRAAATAAGARGYVLKDNLLELRGLLQSAAAKESYKQSSMNEE